MPPPQLPGNSAYSRRTAADPKVCEAASICVLRKNRARNGWIPADTDGYLKTSVPETTITPPPRENPVSPGISIAEIMPLMIMNKRGEAYSSPFGASSSFFSSGMARGPNSDTAKPVPSAAARRNRRSGSIKFDACAGSTLRTEGSSRYLAFIRSRAFDCIRKPKLFSTERMSPAGLMTKAAGERGTWYKMAGK